MITLEHLSSMPYESAAFRGGVLPETLHVLIGRGFKLPKPLEALVLSSDLQGREPQRHDGSRRLLGVALAEQLLRWSTDGKLPSPEHTGVILGGDLYADGELSARGVSGDVSEVWHAFARDYRWVAGVLGNHDTLDDREELEELDNVHILDGDERQLDGLRIAGIAGIMGRTTKLNRKEPAAYLSMLRKLAGKKPDLLVLHEGPRVRERRLLGSDEIRSVLDETKPPLVASGHCHWKTPVVELNSQTTLLNLDARVIVLSAAS